MSGTSLDSERMKVQCTLCGRKFIREKQFDYKYKVWRAYWRTTSMYGKETTKFGVPGDNKR